MLSQNQPLCQATDTLYHFFVFVKYHYHYVNIIELPFMEMKNFAIWTNLKLYNGKVLGLKMKKKYKLMKDTLQTLFVAWWFWRRPRGF